MVAIPVGLALQVTLPVMFCLLPSLNVSVAVNCWVVCIAIEALDGVTASDTNFGLIVTLNDPEIEFMVAVTDTVPLDVALNMPAAEIVTIPVGVALQLTDDVRSFVDLSL